MRKYRRLSKNLHRSMLCKFKIKLQTKADEYGRLLILSDPMFPRLQRCSKCGTIKTGVEKLLCHGNAKTHTGQVDTIVTQCGARMRREVNAVYNQFDYAKSKD